MVEIMIVVATIGLLATVAIPNYVKARGASQRQACINNLRQLDGAVQQYALENKQNATSTVSLDDCTPYLKNSVICPSGGTDIYNSYTVTDCATPPICQKNNADALLGHVMPQ